MAVCFDIVRGHPRDQDPRIQIRAFVQRVKLYALLLLQAPL